MTDLHLSAQVRDSFKSSFLVLIENEDIYWLWFNVYSLLIAIHKITWLLLKELSLKINKAQRDMLRSAMT